MGLHQTKADIQYQQKQQKTYIHMEVEQVLNI